MKKIVKISEAQDLVKKFAKDHKWEDLPNIDKFDHLHEELIGMSQHLRYKNQKDRRYWENCPRLGNPRRDRSFWSKFCRGQRRWFESYCSKRCYH